jgi:hypothetical protein
VTETGSLRVLSGIPLSAYWQQPSQSPLQPQAPPQLHEPPQHSFGSSTGLPLIVGGGGTRFASAKNFSSTGDFMWNTPFALRSITSSDGSIQFMQSWALLGLRSGRGRWLAQSGHWQVNPHVQPEPASVVKVLKGGTTGVGPGTSGKRRGGRSSTSVGVNVGEEGAVVSKAYSSDTENDVVC